MLAVLYPASAHFHARKQCRARCYEYLMPAWALDPQVGTHTHTHTHTHVLLVKECHFLTLCAQSKKMVTSPCNKCARAHMRPRTREQ